MIWITILFQMCALICSQEDPLMPSTVYVKQSGNESNSGLEIGKEKKSLNDAYGLLRSEDSCFMKIVVDENPLTAEAVVFNKEHGITIEGVYSDKSGNTDVEIDCDVHPGCNLIECSGIVTFQHLTFQFPTTLRKRDQTSGAYHLILSNMASLSISNCRFVRTKTGNEINYRLVEASGGSLTMESVECTDETKTLISRDYIFRILGAETVILSNFSLKNVEAISTCAIFISSFGTSKMNVLLNNCTFSEIKCLIYGSMFVEIMDDESTFSIGDGGVTSFSSCSSQLHDYAGGVYVKYSSIKSTCQLNLPEDGRNLIFDNCSSGEDELKKNTGICFSMQNDSLFKDIAAEMKKSFAANYTRDNLWFVAAYHENKGKIYDFVLMYFDLSGKIFVKSKGTGDGLTSSSPSSSLKGAFSKLDEIPCSDGYFIEIVKDESPFTAEEILISNEKGITVEGVNSSENGNTEVAINCDVSASSILFTCEKEVEFKYLAFNFPISETKWNYVIKANEESTSLTISNCKFIRVSSQTSPDEMVKNGDEDGSMSGSLVSVTGGKVTLNTVTCTDERNTVSFSSSPFSFSGASEVSLNRVEISKVNVQNGAAISIRDKSDSSSKVSIEGLNMNEVKSEKGAAAGLDITLSSKESRVAIGRSSKCSFKSCTAPKGKAGAIIIDMPKATSNLQLPSEHNLDIDSSNTAGSKTTSLFIIALDFEEFCKQEDAFAFANDYDESTSGWIEGAIDEESEPEDVYEKYLKEKEDPTPGDPTPEGPAPKGKKKSNAGTVVAIVVPIVVVVIAAIVVVVIIVVVVKKKKAKHNADESKEQEMSSQE
ncbi:uncharacterized protein MONOS_2232 [Monocercomonoides exilis]|uniref:uncharacterized protein n=1 Tax=Monocercomonoides exilis TaxID=2049356 RepID=UPI00355966E2|nr:hypothetical protein MONOS_2232 [Monocercomonoides exilis]|eukprot:MONOS_2232.1-p1 / transcript=MONOS_2232.1 / gene=MONOS_2232 / organism=Monocercomonoides_exilis_PA203 / gene_product=unspecified product / transcript_product=unspecified product / location=Mono_scaffold00045:7909-10383(-) / protein_length=825 / sequence_SO=supercontig / SO=protein_coding / is_pseudo=false